MLHCPGWAEPRASSAGIQCRPPRFLSGAGGERGCSLCRQDLAPLPQMLAPTSSHICAGGLRLKQPPPPRDPGGPERVGRRCPLMREPG